jgi:hypothetical protein
MKNTVVRLLSIAALLMATTLLQGCIIAAVGAGIGAIEYADAQHKEAYTHYRTSMERVNIDREKLGLRPSHIMSYGEWADAH